MCQGFRVSELELYCAITKLVQKLQWTTPTGTTEPYMELFIRPKDELDIKFRKLD